LDARCSTSWDVPRNPFPARLEQGAGPTVCFGLPQRCRFTATLFLVPKCNRRESHPTVRGGWATNQPAGLVSAVTSPLPLLPALGSGRFASVAQILNRLAHTAHITCKHQ